MILKENNNKQIELILLLSKLLATNANSNIDSILIRTNSIDNITNAIISNYYKEQVDTAIVNNSKLKGIIRFKPNSWLNLVDINKITSSMKDFNISPIDDTTVKNIVNRIKLEVTDYKNIVENKLLDTVATINKYKSTLQPSKAISDLFNINIIKPLDIVDLMKSKEYFSFDETTGKADDLSDLVTLAYELSNIETITTDPEVLLELKDELKDMNENQLLNKISDIYTSINISKAINNIGLADINVLIVMLAILKNKIRTITKDNALYNQLNYIIFMVITRLNALLDKFNIYTNNGVLVASVIKHDGVVIFNVINDVYQKLIDAKKGLRVLVGSYLLNSDINKDIVDIELPTYIRLQDVIDNAITYEDAANEYNKSLILARQNNDVNKIVSYCIFGIYESFPKLTDEQKEVIKRYLLKANLAELNNIEKIVLDIAKKIIYKNSNFSIFADAMEEANIILGNTSNTKLLAGYATLKLIVL